MSADIVGSTLEVTAMVPGVSESDGTCVLELIESEGSATVTGTAGNGVTYCGVMSATVPAAGAADGRFRISYSSSSTRAESAITTLESTR